MRYIESDEHQCMRGDKLEEAIINDKAKGLVPFWVSRFCIHIFFNIISVFIYFVYNIHTKSFLNRFFLIILIIYVVFEPKNCCILSNRFYKPFFKCHN